VTVGKHPQVIRAPGKGKPGSRRLVQRPLVAQVCRQSCVVVIIQ